MVNCSLRGWCRLSVVSAVFLKTSLVRFLVSGLADDASACAVWFLQDEVICSALQCVQLESAKAFSFLYNFKWLILLQS